MWPRANAEAPKPALRACLLAAPRVASPVWPAEAADRCSCPSTSRSSAHTRQVVVTCRTRACGLPWSTVAASSAQGVAGSTLESKCTAVFDHRPPQAMDVSHCPAAFLGENCAAAWTGRRHKVWECQTARCVQKQQESSAAELHPAGGTPDTAGFRGWWRRPGEDSPPG
jgi:hypothetical protein